MTLFTEANFEQNKFNDSVPQQKNCQRKRFERKTSDRVEKRPADVYLTPGSWVGEHFSCHQGTLEGHVLSGVNKSAIGRNSELR